MVVDASQQSPSPDSILNSDGVDEILNLDGKNFIHCWVNFNGFMGL